MNILVDFFLFSLVKAIADIEKSGLFVYNSREKVWTTTKAPDEAEELYLTFIVKIYNNHGSTRSRCFRIIYAAQHNSEREAYQGKAGTDAQKLHNSQNFRTRGYYLGGDWSGISENVEKVARSCAADKWLPLLQLDAVECGDFSLMFGDCGRDIFLHHKGRLIGAAFRERLADFTVLLIRPGNCGRLIVYRNLAAQVNLASKRMV